MDILNIRILTKVILLATHQTTSPFAVHYQKVYYHQRQPQTHKCEDAFILMNQHSSMVLSRSIKIFA